MKSSSRIVSGRLTELDEGPAGEFPYMVDDEEEECPPTPFSMDDAAEEDEPPPAPTPAISLGIKVCPDVLELTLPPPGGLSAALG